MVGYFSVQRYTDNFSFWVYIFTVVYDGTLWKIPSVLKRRPVDRKTMVCNNCILSYHFIYYLGRIGKFVVFGKKDTTRKVFESFIAQGLFVLQYRTDVLDANGWLENGILIQIMRWLKASKDLGHKLCCTWVSKEFIKPLEKRGKDRYHPFCNNWYPLVPSDVFMSTWQRFVNPPALTG